MECIGNHKGLTAILLWLVVLLMAFAADVKLGLMLVAVTLMVFAVCLGAFWCSENDFDL